MTRVAVPSSFYCTASPGTCGAVLRLLISQWACLTASTILNLCNVPRRVVLLIYISTVIPHRRCTRYKGGVTKASDETALTAFQNFRLIALLYAVVLVLKALGAGFFFDSWRRKTHPHVWFLNTPVVLWYLADKFWCSTRGRRGVLVS